LAERGLGGEVRAPILPAAMNTLADSDLDRQIDAELDLARFGSPAATRVVVAMSGGVDSSVCAALLKARGYDVVGITLQLYDQGAASGRKGACCAGQDIRDARNVADALDLPHYVLDYEARFRAAVIDDFAESYLSGETPIPCLRCNQTVKFRDLAATARELGARALITGHYARRIAGEGGAELHRAADLARDQSYFLCATTAEQLAFARFPLGGLDKAATRALARRFDLPVAAKPDSQDICFVPEGRYADVLAKLRPGAARPGDIVDRDGRVLGRHDGIARFTIGQRRGLNLNIDGEPLYVLALDAAADRVVVGPRAALGARHVRLREVNWLGPACAGECAVNVKLRSMQAPLAATIDVSGDRAELVLEEPEVAAPGQACAIYAGTRVLGGGIIDRAPR
jgi:tRNA-uridine 2-sulfurtransferase